MIIEIAMSVSGFLFLFILVLDAAMMAFGGFKLGDYDSDAKLQKINNDPKNFK